jgi:hypothetical protein
MSFTPKSVRLLHRARIGLHPTDPLPTQGSWHRLTDPMSDPDFHQFYLRLNVLPIRLPFRLILENVSQRSTPGHKVIFAKLHVSGWSNICCHLLQESRFCYDVFGIFVPYRWITSKSNFLNCLLMLYSTGSMQCDVRQASCDMVFCWNVLLSYDTPYDTLLSPS